MNILIKEFTKHNLLDKSDLKTHKLEDETFYDLKHPHMTLMKLKNDKESFFDVKPITSLYKEHDFGTCPI